MTRVCFVCLGNICRSPMAEGVFAHLVRTEDLAGRFEIESAAVGPWHVGEPPDPRATRTARAHGVALDCVAKQITARDFARFDLILALDSEVAGTLRRIAPSPADRAKVRLLREFDPEAARPASRAAPDLDVPDPYYGGMDGFENVYAMIERACRGLLEHLRHAA